MGPYTAVRQIKHGRFVLRACQRLKRGFPRAGFGPSSSAVRASPFPTAPKASDLDFLPHGRLEISTSKTSFQRSGLQRNSFRLLRRLLTSPPRSRALRPAQSGVRTRRRSPEVSSTAFPARPPDLPPQPLMTTDFTIRCSLVRLGRPRYPVLVHRAAVLLHTSFRPRLARRPCASLTLRRRQAG
jgi:hypothetical protein